MHIGIKRLRRPNVKYRIRYLGIVYTLKTARYTKYTSQSGCSTNESRPLDPGLQVFQIFIRQLGVRQTNTANGPGQQHHTHADDTEQTD